MISLIDDVGLGLKQGAPVLIQSIHLTTRLPLRNNDIHLTSVVRTF